MVLLPARRTAELESRTVVLVGGGAVLGKLIRSQNAAVHSGFGLRAVVLFIVLIILQLLLRLRYQIRVVWECPCLIPWAPSEVSAIQSKTTNSALQPSCPSAACHHCSTPNPGRHQATAIDWQFLSHSLGTQGAFPGGPMNDGSASPRCSEGSDDQASPSSCLHHGANPV